MLLIFPPMTKACEPPAGIAYLAGVLKVHGVKSKVLDLNLAIQNHLLQNYFQEHPKKAHYLAQLKDIQTYHNRDRYKRAVSEITRAIQLASTAKEKLTLADYSHDSWNPYKSSDLKSLLSHYKESMLVPLYQKELEPILQKGDIQHLGISVQYLNQAIPAFILMAYIKERFPDISIVLGGGLITSWCALERWTSPFHGLIDKLIAGPGEEALLEYLGIAPDPRKLQELQPDYSWVQWEHYFSPGPVVPVSASLGCSWRRCRFCPEKAEGNRYIPRKPDEVLYQIQRVEESFHPRLLHFTDNEISGALLRVLTEQPPRTAWYGFTKFYSQLKDPDFCYALKEANCALLKLGLESGDQKVLNQLDKGFSLEDASLILTNLEKAGISTYVYLLFGTPSEDIHSARKTVSFIEKHHSSITYLNCAIFNMPIANREFSVKDILPPAEKDLSLYKEFQHDKGWDRREVRRFLKEELRSSPLVRAILSRTPPGFTSNHAAFMVRSSSH